MKKWMTPIIAAMIAVSACAVSVSGADFTSEASETEVFSDGSSELLLLNNRGDTAEEAELPVLYVSGKEVGEVTVPTDAQGKAYVRLEVAETGMYYITYRSMDFEEGMEETMVDADIYDEQYELFRGRDYESFANHLVELEAGRTYYVKAFTAPGYSGDQPVAVVQSLPGPSVVKIEIHRKPTRKVVYTGIPYYGMLFDMDRFDTTISYESLSGSRWTEYFRPYSSIETYTRQNYPVTYAFEGTQDGRYPSAGVRDMYLCIGGKTAVLEDVTIKGKEDFPAVKNYGRITTKVRGAVRITVDRDGRYTLACSLGDDIYLYQDNKKTPLKFKSGESIELKRGIEYLAVSRKNTVTYSLTAPVPEKGKNYAVDGLKYKVTKSSATSGTVTLYGPVDRNCTSAVVPSTVKIKGYTFKVTGISNRTFKDCTKLKKVIVGSNVTVIGKESFYGCKSLKAITISGKNITAMGSNALKGIYSKAVIKVPSTRVRTYTRLFAGKGQSKYVTITK